jgi:hypothetical protein
MNSGKGKPPLYPCRRKEKVIQVLIRPSRKRKAEYDHVTVVKRPRRCNRKRKREDNITILTPFKRTRLDEDQEEVPYGLRILEMHDAACHDATDTICLDDTDSIRLDATDTKCLDATDSVCDDTADIQTKVKSSHLGSIWFPHTSFGLVRRSLRVSKLGSSWVAHPKHGLLRRSGRIAASSKLRP